MQVVTTSCESKLYKWFFLIFIEPFLALIIGPGILASKCFTAAIGCCEGCMCLNFLEKKHISNHTAKIQVDLETGWPKV